ncbi:hypothetical protein BH24CHL4_BH24CHL4_00010 [soil metagenome]
MVVVNFAVFTMLSSASYQSSAMSCWRLTTGDYHLLAFAQRLAAQFVANPLVTRCLRWYHRHSTVRSLWLVTAAR